MKVVELFELSASLCVEYLGDPHVALWHQEMTKLAEKERSGELEPGPTRECLINAAINSVGNGLTREEITDDRA